MVGRYIFCDFDGTITEKDVSLALLDKFTDGSWRNMGKSVAKGNIGSKGAYLLIKDVLNSERKLEKDSMVKFSLDFVKISDGFEELVSYCKDNKVKFLVVSDGFDLYIEPILSRIEENIEYYAIHMEVEDGQVKFSFPNSVDFCDLCATCKLHILRKFNGFKVYIGNGISDRCPIEEADVVFAKLRLIDICRDRSVDFITFDNFREVLRILKKKTKAFIFDFDGTLAYSYEGIIDAFSYTFEKFGLEKPDKGTLLKLIGLPLRECFVRTMGEELSDRAVKTFRERYEKICVEKTYLIDGVKETLEFLKENGFKMSVCSNKNGNITRRLCESLGIKKYFDAILGEGDSERPKPFPNMVTTILDIMGFERGEVFFVGDTPQDKLTAENSGIDPIILLNGIFPYEDYKGARIFIHNITGLKKISEIYLYF